MSNPDRAKYLPVMVDLSGRPALLIGEGTLADEKEKLLRDAGARVVRAGSLPARLDEFFLVLYAGGDPEKAREYFAAVNACGRLFCSVDDPENCSMIFPAAVRSGAVQVSVSTGGLSPTLARRIKDRIEKEILGEHTGRFAEFLGRMRSEFRSSLSGMEEKRAFWDFALERDLEKVFLASGDAEAADAVRALFADFKKTQEKNNGG